MTLSSTDPIQQTTGKIAFIQASWHKGIVDQGKLGFMQRLTELNIDPDNVDVFELPGAFEIPLKCKELSQGSKYSAIVAAGFVVDGGIYRHEFVAQAVISGLMNVQLETGTPIISMVLTPHDFDDSAARNEYFLKHFLVKGAESADAVSAVLKNA